MVEEERNRVEEPCLSAMSDGIKVIRYETLKECFLGCIEKKELTDEDARKNYWVGHNGKRGFRIRVDKWLGRDEKVWAWANYKKREVHIYTADDANVFEIIEVLSHEIGHFQRPRYPFGNDEEKKAEIYRKVTKTAINIAKSIKGNV